MSLPEIAPNTKRLKSRIDKNNKRKQTVLFLFYVLKKKKSFRSDFIHAVVVFQTNVSWDKCDTDVSKNLIENISEENDNVKREMESEVCVSIKDATFAWPNSKIPVLVVDNLKIEEGIYTFSMFV